MFRADNTTAEFTIASIGGIDGFVGKYNSDGTPLWLRRLGGTNTDSAHSIAVDSSGNVFVCGYTSGNLSIFDGSGVATITSNLTGIEDGYLVKYATDGTPQWLQKFTRLVVSAQAVATDSSGNIYVLGATGHSGDLIASGAATSVTLSTSTGGGFLVKYNTNGNPLWIRGMIGVNTNMFRGVSVDTLSNNIYVVGSYAGTLEILNPNGSTFLSNAGPGSEWDIGIVKYESDGTPKWLRRMGSINEDRGLGISSDSLGNVYVTGFYSGTLSVFNAAGTAPATTVFTTLTNAAGTADSVIVKYDTTGLPLWATSVGGTGSDIGRGIAVDSSGNIYSTGVFTSNPLTLRTTGF